MNYFKIICFIWALIGILSRIIMGIMGPKWKTWELNQAYAPKRPLIITVIGITGYLIVVFTWYMVFHQPQPHAWIIALLVSLTVIKISTILFRYNIFRTFASQMLQDSNKMKLLNIGVLIYSIVLIAMGILLY